MAAEGMGQRYAQSCSVEMMNLTGEEEARLLAIELQTVLVA